MSQAALELVKLVTPTEPNAVTALRHAATEFAAEHGADQTLVSDVALAVSEAATNAVKHANPRAGEGLVSLTASVVEDWLEIRVADRGFCFGSGESDGLGLGLAIIASLCAELTICQEGSGTEVTMRFPLPLGSPS